MKKSVFFLMSVWCIGAMGQNVGMNAETQADENGSRRIGVEFVPGFSGRDGINGQTERRHNQTNRRDDMSVSRDDRNERRHEFHSGRDSQFAPRPVPEVRYVTPAATPEQVEMIVDCVRKESFDDGKLRVAKLSVTLCPIMSQDLKDIARLFSFDDDRLKFLQYAYAFCPDRERFIVMNSTFTFSSSFDKLVDYIEDYEKKQNLSD